MPASQWIHWLGRGTPDPSLLGGKGAGLDRLLRLGFPAPPGFCVTTAAYAQFLDETGLRARVAGFAAQLPDPDARAALAALSFQPQWPAGLSVALAEAVDTLLADTTDRLLAVRSSAVGEDAGAASYAGQHETLLGVRPADIEDALRRCWSSLWSERAVAYRLRRNLGFADTLMAVVVQPALPADASAVVFTRHPVSRRDDEILINAARGLGEAIVSGEITPDTIILDKATLAVRHLTTADKPFWLRLKSDGGVEAVQEATPEPALTDEEIRTLGELALRVERTLGAPVDIEAAHSHGRWYLLQARPITT